MFHPDILSRGGGGQTRVLEMLRRGGINHQTVRQNKVKIQGGGTRDTRGGSKCLNETLFCEPRLRLGRSLCALCILSGDDPLIITTGGSRAQEGENVGHGYHDDGAGVT